MNINICRNIYYVKENLLEFLHQNKKQIIFLIIAFVIGLSLGICVGINNSSTFTFINISDKSVIAIFSGGNFLSCWIKVVLHYAFICLLILAINNFQWLSFINYILFSYLMFMLTVNISIIFCTLHLKSILYILLCYLPFNLVLLLLLCLLFLICNSTIVCNKSKFVSYPYKIIIAILLTILVISILLILLSKIFSKFIIIII